MKTLVFDMDGTLADFYGVSGWLDYLHESNPTPYIVATPLYNVESVNALLNMLKTLGYKVIVTSWLAKDSTKEFDTEVRQAKRDWLEKVGFPYDEIHLVKYGTTKANCTRKYGYEQILFDDNEKVRNGWNLGSTVDVTKESIENFLKEILKNGLTD